MGKLKLAQFRATIFDGWAWKIPLTPDSTWLYFRQLKCDKVVITAKVEVKRACWSRSIPTACAWRKTLIDYYYCYLF